MYLDSGGVGAPAARRSNRPRWTGSRFGRFVETTGSVVPAPAARSRDADGAGGLAVILGRRTPAEVVFFHGRQGPDGHGSIDHIAVASSGVWVIAVDDSCGRVERRALGGWRASDRRLLVGGRDRTASVAGLAWQVDAVRSVVAPLAIDVALHPVLCFTRSEWSLLSAPFKIDGVLVTDPRALATAVSADGVLITAEARAIAGEIDRRLAPT